jgi:hypothetical protein
MNAFLRSRSGEFRQIKMNLSLTLEDIHAYNSYIKLQFIGALQTAQSVAIKCQSVNNVQKNNRYLL